MSRVIRCECGFETVGDADDELVAGAQRHARDVHSQDVADELLLSLVQAGPGPATPQGGQE